MNGTFVESTFLSTENASVNLLCKKTVHEESNIVLTLQK